MLTNFMSHIKGQIIATEEDKINQNVPKNSVTLGALRSHTAKVSTKFVSSFKTQSNKVTNYIWNKEDHINGNYRKNNLSSEEKERLRTNPPSLLEQLKWPVLVNNSFQWSPSVNSDDPEEEDIIEKFIRVIKVEDCYDNSQDTFYNHPTRRRNDREEIRRKLAMGFDEDFERPLRKPSLQSRLQSGMNLQICFMNETASDCESQCSDTESTQDRIEDNVVDVTGSTTSLNIKGSTPIPTKMRKSKSGLTGKEPMDFFTRQAQLQTEARMALGQAKEMARMQMEIEKQQKKKSPIADIVRESMLKIGVHFPDSKRRVSRQILTDMNIAQLQVIVNDLHTQIESLNGDLVTMLLERDDLHMEQDSMLVDIEDLTKHMGAKELSLREEQSETQSLSNARCSPKMTASPKRPRSKSLKLTGSPRK
ncbi:unnamed protein product [Meganyctiphanes norvegica]|uniref:Schwannomin interacting protein 1 C-terminal domain-containing protein n=1 Tax=Meganyctiphanes norvegica TaxID=48144 RepID=A0AAV2R438_MEGNR